MSVWPRTLRGRLVTTMFAMFLVGIAGAAVLHLFQAHVAPVGLPTDLDDLPEPYQDMVVLVPFGLCAMLLIWLVSGWSLRTLDAASTAASAIGAANPGARLSTRGLPDEVRPLVQAMNGALDRLAEAYAAEKRFVANAAHELRTPLTVLDLRLQRAQLDGVLDWPALDRDVAQMNRLVGQLLDLARKEHAGPLWGAGVEVADLSRLAREAAATLLPRAEEAGRSLHLDLDFPFPVWGRAADLRDMIRNLLENGLVHGAGTVTLMGRADHDGWLRLRVSDEGPGIPAESRALALERFWKGRPDTDGHGLGLAIVREVVRAHGGSVQILDAPTCEIEVRLPVPAADRETATVRRAMPVPRLAG